MNRFLNTIFSLSAVSLLLAMASCERQELPVPVFVSQAQIGEVDMSSDYRWQVYYSLEQNRVVGKNLQTDWDLGFEASEFGTRIILNNSKAMYAMPISEANLALVEVSDTLGFAEHKRWDDASGKADSGAFTNWQNSMNSSYIIDRGYGIDGTRLGFRKLRILSVGVTGYQIICDDIDGSKPVTVTIPKNGNYNYTFFSFDGNKVVNVEPPKRDWDIVFTQYSHTFYSPSYMPYRVTGCLLNSTGTMAARCNDSLTFETVDRSELNTMQLTPALNAIGYDWKDYNFDQAKYTAFVNKIYLVRTTSGRVWKLHFIDFNDANGIKGHPKFEYQEI